MPRIYIDRVFRGDYVANHDKLREKKYRICRRIGTVITITSANHGFAKVSGRVRKSGIPQPNLTAMCFSQNDGQRLWGTTTDNQGFYKFINIADDLEVFVIVFDPTGGAKVKDMIIAKR